MPTKQLSSIAAVVLRVLLALLFIVSAVAKLMAIDDFELYVFSYGFFSLNVVYVLVRLCIGAELLLGLLIAAGWWRRWVNLAALAMLLFFSLFLCYAALNGRNESCQCFGRLADMPPAVSLLKNAVLILMVLVYNKLSASMVHNHRRWMTYVAVACGVVAMVVPFVVSVPDSWMFGPEDGIFDRELLQQTVEEQHWDEGQKLVAFVTPGCPYCKMTRSKLTSIANRHDIDEASIIYIEPDDIGSDLFLKITYGQRPLVVMLDEGKPVVTYHYRNINERQISRFLTQGSL